MIKHTRLNQIVAAVVIAMGASTSSYAAIVPYAGETSPVIGASVIATGGHVIATFLSGGGFYDNYLYLSSPAGSAFENASSSSIGGNWIFENHISVAGTTVDLGDYAAGTELIFNVLSDTHGGGLLNWYTGPASRNSDGLAHAFIDSSAAAITANGGSVVGFEDLAGLGDAGYEDLRYAFSNVRSSVPEPASIALLALGLIGIGAARRRA